MYDVINTKTGKAIKRFRDFQNAQTFLLYLVEQTAWPVKVVRVVRDQG